MLSTRQYYTGERTAKLNMDLIFSRYSPSLKCSVLPLILPYLLTFLLSFYAFQNQVPFYWTFEISSQWDGSSRTRASPVAQEVKNLPAVQETQVQSLGWENSLEKGMATYSSILAWRIPWAEEPGRLQSMGLQSWTQLSD